MTDESKGARVLTDEERTVDISEFRLPPEELHDELDNSGQSRAGAVEEPAASKPVTEPDYVDGPEQAIVPLKRPFRIDGRIVQEIVARPLSVAETGALVTKIATPDVFDFYSEMTGIPAAIIRGLRGADGDAVTEACYPFLPRFMRGGG